MPKSERQLASAIDNLASVSHKSRVLLRYSHHAEERMAEQGITRQAVEPVLGLTPQGKVESRIIVR